MKKRIKLIMVNGSIAALMFILTSCAGYHQSTNQIDTTELAGIANVCKVVFKEYSIHEYENQADHKYNVYRRIGGGSDSEQQAKNIEMLQRFSELSSDSELSICKAFITVY